MPKKRNTALEPSTLVQVDCQPVGTEDLKDGLQMCKVNIDVVGCDDDIVHVCPGNTENVAVGVFQFLDGAECLVYKAIECCWRVAKPEWHPNILKLTYTW